MAVPSPGGWLSQVGGGTSFLLSDQSLIHRHLTASPSLPSLPPVPPSRTRGVPPSLPIVVHHIVGRDVQEAASPSWFNVEEIAQVRGVALNLGSSRR